MRRPLTVVVAVIGIVFCSFLALQQMKKDILPNLGIPIIYVAQPYTGMDASQMESYITYYFEYHFLYIAGIEHIESKNVQSAALIKLQFYPGTDMAQALSETVNYVNRAKAFMPAGMVAPFVVRFDSGGLSVGDVVVSSPKRTLAELQDFALNYVRPMFATLPGVSATPPFGAGQRTVVVSIDPAKLSRYHLSPEDVVLAVSRGNQPMPSGNIIKDGMYPVMSLNSVAGDIHELDELPLRVGTYPVVLLKDVATVKDGADLQVGYALVNGKRTIYLPLTKRSDASTLSVVDEVKRNLARFQSMVPEDVKVTYEFDQSGYVRRAISSLVLEGVLGAILTGLMVLLFLRDPRSAFIVVLNIPLALMGAILALWVTKQTINIMSLGGLALAIGVLVDETTVTIENIHTHRARGKSLAQASLDASSEMVTPLLMTMLCVLAVFIPSFFMSGVAHALFVPVALAVGFSMVASFFLSRTLIPVLSVWILKEKPGHTPMKKGIPFFSGFRENYARILGRSFPFRKLILGVYLAGTLGIILLLFGFFVGREIFPQVDTGQFQVRFRAPSGTLIDQTEAVVLKAIDIIKAEAGPENVESSLSYVGTMPDTAPVNMIHLWTSGPQEAVLQVTLKPQAHVRIEAFKETLRRKFAEKIPETEISFEPSSMVDRIMSLGANTPIEVAASGRDLAEVRAYAEKIRDALKGLPFLRDLQFGQDFDYPAVKVTGDRKKVGILGTTLAAIGTDLVPATSSSRFILPTFWADMKKGINYQVQVEVPPGTFQLKDIPNLPVSLNGGVIPLSRLADVQTGTTIGEYDRYNMQRVASVTANLSGLDLGRASQRILEALKPLESSKPRGVEVHFRGQMEALNNIFYELTLGLLLAIGVIFLLLAANFESASLALVVLSAIPAVLGGVGLTLFLSGTTLNLQSFMGAIMAVGIAVANAILLVTFAERSRLSGVGAWKAAVEGARGRLRPILMTSFAMIGGMLPMALGWGEGGQQAAPLGRAVIGGLIGATLATLVILPLVFAMVQKIKPVKSPSLNPNDPESGYYDGQRRYKG